jgi:hypothetical protein
MAHVIIWTPIGVALDLIGRIPAGAIALHVHPLAIRRQLIVEVCEINLRLCGNFRPRICRGHHGRGGRVRERRRLCGDNWGRRRGRRRRIDRNAGGSGKRINSDAGGGRCTNHGFDYILGDSRILEFDQLVRTQVIGDARTSGFGDLGEYGVLPKACLGEFDDLLRAWGKGFLPRLGPHRLRCIQE